MPDKHPMSHWIVGIEDDDGYAEAVAIRADTVECIAMPRPDSSEGEMLLMFESPESTTSLMRARIVGESGLYSAWLACHAMARSRNEDKSSEARP